MVFSSIPAYLDPSNWQQQQNHQIIGSSSTNPLLPPPPPPPPSHPHGGGGAGSIRPGSMSERARMANIPMPETQLKCPRCESTNTKFCYFNNYSLSQPRHFCKTCRRYWTRGGALRTVPVGGGCRRNKRSKSTSSKSPASGEVIRQNTPNSTSTVSSNGSGAANMLGLTSSSQFQPLRFMSPLSQLTDNFTSGMSLNYTGIPNTSDQMNFNLLGGGGGGVASLLSSGGGGGIEPWRMQPFPFLDGLDSSQVGINYQFHDGGDLGFHGGDERSHPKLSSSMLTQLESVKMEGNPHELNLSGQFLGAGKMPENNNNNNNNNNNQWNSTATWSDLSSFRSSSTSNPQ